MGMAAGGDAIHMDQFFTTCPWIMPESLVKGIFVNERGQRFINEDCYHGRVSRTMLDQPGDRVFLLVDNAIFARPLELNIRTSYFSYFTLGGLNTLPTGEVLDRAGQPIPGLYAAGRATCGLPRWGHGYSSGLSLADCTFFGRLAGRSAAAV
jgi:hypothetical protein